MKNFKPKALASIMFAFAIAPSAWAVTEDDLTEENITKITEMLTEEGYEVGKFKIEDELYEVYVKKDGAKYEIFLDENFEIVRVVED